MNKFRLIAPVLALVALLFSATPSRADLQIALQEAGVNGGAITVVSTVAGGPGGATSVTQTYGDFKVTIFGGSSDNGASLSDLLSATTSVTNNSGTTKTLKLWVTQTDYTLPTGNPLNVESGLGGSVNNGTLGLTGIFQAYASYNNTPFDTTDFTNGPQNATMSGTTYDTGSKTGLFDRTGTAPFTLTTLVIINLSGGGKINFSAHENVTSTAAVPAPAGLVLAFSGAAALFLARLRRRKAQES
jgi:hypothetical protein